MSNFLVLGWAIIPTHKPKAQGPDIYLYCYLVKHMYTYGKKNKRVFRFEAGDLNL